jgi:hypothetical protein
VGLVLLAVFCVLFVPIRYRIFLAREEGEDKPPLVVRAKVTWLFHLLNVRIRYPLERQYVRARIFLFTVFSVPEKEKKASRKNQVSGSKEKEKKTDAVHEKSARRRAERTRSGGKHIQ